MINVMTCCLCQYCVILSVVPPELLYCVLTFLSLEVLLSLYLEPPAEFSDILYTIIHCTQYYTVHYTTLYISILYTIHVADKNMLCNNRFFCEIDERTQSSTCTHWCTTHYWIHSVNSTQQVLGLKSSALVVQNLFYRAGFDGLPKCFVKNRS